MSTTGPNQVLIVRHGEKLGDSKKDNDGGRHLSIQGSARAAALPSLFIPALPELSCKLDHKGTEFIGLYRSIPLKGKAARFPTPNFIFATERSKQSKRPIETASPLATALNLPVNDQYGDNPAEIKKMTDAILGELAFAGKLVLI